MKLYYQEDGIQLYHGDSTKYMASLADDSFSAVITDPPYNVRAEDIEFDDRADMKRDFGEWDQDWHAAPDFVTECARVLAPGGSLLAFASDKLIGEYQAMHETLKPRSVIVWEKTNPPPQPRPGYVQTTEYIVWMQKPGAAATWNGSGYVRNIERFPSPARSERAFHPTQKPIALLAVLVARHTNKSDLILDPFVGSGTTLVAARRAGRRAVGVELDEHYCEIAMKRLKYGTLRVTKDHEVHKKACRYPALPCICK